MIARARANSGALWLLAATTIANVLGFGYQLVMARLLTAEQYAILIALFGVLILEAISSQVIQSATAKLTAQYRARGDEAALHQFVRRWSLRVASRLSVIRWRVWPRQSWSRMDRLRGRRSRQSDRRQIA